MEEPKNASDGFRLLLDEVGVRDLTVKLPQREQPADGRAETHSPRELDRMRDHGHLGGAVLHGVLPIIALVASAFGIVVAAIGVYMIAVDDDFTRADALRLGLLIVLALLTITQLVTTLHWLLRRAHIAHSAPPADVEWSLLLLDEVPDDQLAASMGDDFGKDPMLAVMHAKARSLRRRVVWAAVVLVAFNATGAVLVLGAFGDLGPLSVASSFGRAWLVAVGIGGIALTVLAAVRGFASHTRQPRQSLTRRTIHRLLDLQFRARSASAGRGAYWSNTAANFSFIGAALGVVFASSAAALVFTPRGDGDMGTNVRAQAVDESPTSTPTPTTTVRAGAPSPGQSSTPAAPSVQSSASDAPASGTAAQPSAAANTPTGAGITTRTPTRQATTAATPTRAATSPSPSVEAPEPNTPVPAPTSDDSPVGPAGAGDPPVAQPATTIPPVPPPAETNPSPAAPPAATSTATRPPATRTPTRPPAPTLPPPPANPPAPPSAVVIRIDMGVAEIEVRLPPLGLRIR